MDRVNFFLNNKVAFSQVAINHINKSRNNFTYIIIRTRIENEWGIDHYYCEKVSDIMVEVSGDQRG